MVMSQGSCERICLSQELLSSTSTPKRGSASSSGSPAASSPSSAFSPVEGAQPPRAEAQWSDYQIGGRDEEEEGEQKGKGENKKGGAEGSQEDDKERGPGEDDQVGH